MTVQFRDVADHGMIGVTAAIIQLVTGAAADGGFMASGLVGASPGAA